MATFRTSDGLTLYYEQTGSGPALLCLAGLTRNSRDFDPLRAALPDAQIITLDYRGRGLSEFDEDYLNYNVLREARDAVVGHDRSAGRGGSDVSGRICGCTAGPGTEALA